MPSTRQHSFFLLRLIKVLGIFFVLLVVGVLLFKDLIVKTIVTRAGSSALGAQMEIGQFSWGLFSGKILIKDLKVDHPSGFERGYFINIPQITVTYDLGSFIQGKYHLPLVLVNLKEMIVVKNQQGQLNVDALKILHPDPNKKVEIPPFHIDVLKLNVGQVIFKDYYKRTSPEVLVYDVDLKDKTFNNIDNIPKLITVIIVQAMKPTAIQGAGVYAAATLMGVGFIPGAVLGLIVAKDSTQAELAGGFDKVFGASVSFVKEKGVLKKADKAAGTILGKVEGTDVTINLEKVSLWKTRLRVSARKMMLPKREFAAGILYQISQRL